MSSTNNRFNGNKSSSLSDLVIKGHLPPQGRQRPNTEARSKRKKKQDWRNSIGNLRRPNSAVVTPLWEHNSQLSIESVPIPLSSRVHSTRTTTPNKVPIKRITSDITKSNSCTQLDHLSTSRFNKSTHSSQTDLSADSSDLLVDTSVDHLSSEIDVILHNINTGLILSDNIESSSQSRTNTFDNDFVTPTTQQTNNSSLNKMKEVSIVKDMPSSVHNHEEEETHTIDWSEEQQTAALTIQRWYRQKQERSSKIKLQQLLQNKREQLKTNLEQKQSFISEEQVLMEEKKQRRDAKMKAARQVAIDKLKKKREEKKKETERIINEEMAQLEEKGKVKKSTKVVTKQSKASTKKNEDAKELPVTSNEINDQEVISHANELKEEVVIDELAQSNGRQKEKEGEKEESFTHDTSKQTQAIDDFFKAGKRKVSPSHSSHHNNPQSSTNTTMEGIFATLKELEEPHPPLPGVQSISPITNERITVGYLSAQNLSLLQNGNTATNDSKLQSILTYLDEVEKSSDLPVVAINLEQKGVEGSGKEEESSLLPNSALNEQMEAASAVANDITTTIATQRLEIDNKNKTIDMLQKALAQQRELTVYHAKEVQKESQKRLELQKEEYETTIQRHQCFIDQLIDDKKKLNDKCEKLLKELKELDKKSKSKISTMEDQHAVELEKQKQTFIAAEKLRRERWRGEETQRIKEATIKSLEPEIQRIIARGKAEIQKLKALHESELLQSDERVSRRFTQQIEELRVQNAQEKEMACQHERELARQKYEQLAEQEEHSYQQLRKKLYSELQLERDKLTAEMNGHNNALEKQIKELKESHINEITRLKAEQESTIAEIQRTHSVELREINERTKIEKQMWEENYLKKSDAILMTREREMRESLRKERDMEIETVIQKLERETAAAKDECERGAESRIKRIREKYETELREVERSEQNTLQKFNSMKGQLSDLEGQVVKLRTHLRIKEEEVAEVNEIATRLTRERDQFADVVRQEFADRLISVEEENRQLKLEMSELQAKHKLDMERHQRGKERELAEVHNRVKQALAKKEENHKNLRKQHDAALKRADHLEMLLEQQRKELLKR